MLTRRRLEQELFRTPPKALTPQYEWRVWYRRLNWGEVQGRTFQSLPFAARLVAKLLSPQSSWQPVVELRVRRRAVGPWQDVPIRTVLKAAPHDEEVRP